MKTVKQLILLLAVALGWMACSGDNPAIGNLQLTADPNTGITQVTGLNELRPPLGPFSPRIDENINLSSASNGQGIKMDGQVLNMPLSAVDSLKILALNQTVSGAAEIAGLIAACGDEPAGICFTVDNIAVARDKSNIISLTLYNGEEKIDQVTLKIDFAIP